MVLSREPRYGAGPSHASGRGTPAAPTTSPAAETHRCTQRRTISRPAAHPSGRTPRLTIAIRRRRARIAALLASLAVPAALTAQAVEHSEIAPGVHLFRTPFDGYVLGSSIAIAGDDGVLVFDTNTRPSTARRVLAELRRITDRPVRTVVNSHWHPDHWTGNEVYTREFAGLRIVSTAVTRDLMRRVSPAWPKTFAGRLARQRAALDSVPAGERREAEAALARYADFVREMTAVRRVLPNTVYGDRLTLHEAGREIRLLAMDGDAAGSTVLWLPKERVVLAGDLLVHPVQWTPNSHRITPWLESLRAVRALDPAVVVPGHGPAFRDTRYLDLVIEWLAAAVSGVDSALVGGAVTVADVQERVRLEEFAGRFAGGDAALMEEYRETVPDLVRRVYLEARDGLESRR